MTDGPAIGRYILERRIASGGMADVYLARQTGSYGFVKHIALKVLKSEIAGDDENVKMFIREALVAAEFRHPNLAQVYEVGENAGKLFIAMELVRGVSIASMLKGLGEREKGMPLNVAVRIAIDTLDGLAHAHEAQGPDHRPLGLVHRDISPQNIMVGVDGAVKVVDFGIARVESAFGRTLAPKIKGKFCYMAPEQWDPRGGLDARADVFALGVVLYEITTGGTRLFRGDTPKDLYKAITLDAIPDPRTRVPEYPEDLARIVMRALERGPNARWPSARAMRTALVNFAEGEGWSMTARAVSDTVRAALGPGEIESHWAPVAGVQPAAAPPADDASSTVVDAETMVRSSSASANVTVAPRLAHPEHPLPSMGVAMGTIGALLALTLGGFGGFAFGRRAGSPAGSVAVQPGTVAGAAVHAGTATTTLRVRAAEALTSDAMAAALRERWQRVHPEIELRLQTERPSEAIGAVIAGTAEMAVAMREPTEAESTHAASAGLDIGPSARTVIGHVVAVLAVHPSNTLPSIDESRARDVFAGRVASWDALAPGLGTMRPVLRRSNDELIARVNESLFRGAPPPPAMESVESEAAAGALAASDSHAITVLALGAVERAGGAVRALPVTQTAPGTTFLSFPLTAVTRGIPSGPARAFIDWIRAPDVGAMLRSGSVVVR